MGSSLLHLWQSLFGFSYTLPLGTVAFAFSLAQLYPVLDSLSLDFSRNIAACLREKILLIFRSTSVATLDTGLLNLVAQVRK